MSIDNNPPDHVAIYPCYNSKGICGEPATTEFDPMMNLDGLCPSCADDVRVEADLLGFIRDDR